MEAQALEGLEDLAGGERGRRSRRLRPLLLYPGRGAPAVLGGEGRGDRDCQRKSHDDAALACHVPLLGAKGASVKPPGDVSAGSPSLASSRAGAYGPPPCRSAASCVPAVRSPPPSRRAWWCVSRASCAIRSCIPTGPRTWSWRARCCAGRSWRCSAGTTRRSIPPPWPGSRRPGSASSWPGRATALLAGLAALPLLHVLVRRCAGERAADAAVLVAAVHPALVKASAQVLPETLAGALLLAWLVARRAGVAGALAGGAYLARPEGVLLLPLGLWRLRRARLGALVLYAGAAVAVMAPALVALRAETGHWQLSPREARVALLTGVPGATTLAEAALTNPAALLARMAEGVARQLLYDATALGPLLVIPFALGLGTAPGTRGPLAVAAWFTALPLALNPSPRYAVPLVPLLLPATAAGLLALGERLGRHARLATAALGSALVVQALWVSHPLAAACSREVSRLVLGRYGPGQALVPVDGRFAYGAHGRALVPPTTDPEAALALARRSGARLWLTRPAWIRPPWTPPADARAVARPCGGTFVLFEVGG